MLQSNRLYSVQRCNRTACIPRMQFKGLGVPQQAFCNANGVCIDRHIACRCYEASQRAFQNLKIILQSRPSAFKFNLKRTVIFLLRRFLRLHSQQAGQVGTNSQFLNQILQIRIQKRLLGFSQTRYSAQNCADRASYPLKALWPTRGPVPSSPLSFCQSFHRLFLQPAESGVFSNLFVDTARFLW